MQTLQNKTESLLIRFHYKAVCLQKIFTDEHYPGIFPGWSVSVEELSAVSLPRGFDARFSGK